MEATEIDTFIRKFYQLWNNGYTAHLDIDTCAGKAWVGLRLHLDHAPGHHHQPAHHQRHFSASRQRRRERRAAAHAASKHAKEASEKSANTEEVNTPAKEIIENKNKEAGTEEIGAGEVENEEVKAEEIEDEIVEAEEAQAEKVEAEKVEGEEAIEAPQTTLPEKEVAKESNENCNEHNDILETSLRAKCPDVIPVYCIATLENCPDANLDDEYGQSIRRFLLSEQHLAQNISSVDLEHLSSRSFSVSHNVCENTQIVGKSCQLREKTSWISKLLGKIQWNHCQTIEDTSEVGNFSPPPFPFSGWLSQNTVIYN